MAFKISNSDPDPNRLTEKQQAEIVQIANQAYDKGSADCLKLLISTIQEMRIQAKEVPEIWNELYSYENSLDGFLAIIEAVRSQLYQVVSSTEENETANIVIP